MGSGIIRLDYAGLAGIALSAWPWYVACSLVSAMKVMALLLSQILALLLINQAGYAVVSALHLPVPGNLLGMLFLLILLVTGVVPLRWIEASASLLIRHLAFFFIPIAVGLMAFGELFLDNGLAILLTLVVSAAVGIWVSGLSAQRLGARGRRTKA
jgi:holin-like protein